jgi:hypothetical protein
VQREPVRVANAIGLDSGLLLGASLRMISAAFVAFVAALALGMWFRSPSGSTSATTRLNVEASASLGSQIPENRQSPADGSGYELASASTTEYGEPAAPRFVKSVATIAFFAPSPQPAKPQTWVGGGNADPDADESDELLEPDDHTAVYDIAAHTVYLPDGTRLEAHSGLGAMRDNPRFVNVRQRGATPPNVYDLSLRENRFHGVQALRLTPVEGGKMFGRDGMLAHTYMLGPSGQSNGCVVFNDYPAFLQAYLNGDIKRLVVVDHLASLPTFKTASRRLPQTVKALLERS